jgi:hypothetical protein
MELCPFRGGASLRGQILFFEEFGSPTSRKVGETWGTPAYLILQAIRTKLCNTWRSFASWTAEAAVPTFSFFPHAFYVFWCVFWNASRQRRAVSSSG